MYKNIYIHILYNYLTTKKYLKNTFEFILYFDLSIYIFRSKEEIEQMPVVIGGHWHAPYERKYALSEMQIDAVPCNPELQRGS